MSIIAIYFIKLLLLPPTSLAMLALVGLLLRKRKWGKNMAIVCLALLWLLSLPIVVKHWAMLWERVSPLSTEAVQQFKPQALVVIGGGIEYSAPEYPGQVTLHVRTLLRVRYAAKLAGELSLPILASGGGMLEPDDIPEADLMAQTLESEFKIPVAWREPRSSNTAENARFSHELLKEFGINKIVLVTQAYHMPRAALEFRKAGFEVLPAPTAFIGHAGKSRWLDWLPSPTAWSNSFLLAHEMVGMWWYRIRY
ncbi:YdcF family protein [Methylomonas sp. OY6]|uniref:YdcF family protein n=1 Tax=Methylomonas defluvii TaxID=3045149 RepID=A0ABU4UEW3_9GAMM|nr:YdcF family protein [Methylomonas sp. OY6]MDX8127390.1 YdcF family protein [Methylomonas sp. OY6]